MDRPNIKSSAIAWTDDDHLRPPQALQPMTSDELDALCSPRDKARALLEFELAVVSANHALQHWLGCSTAASQLHDLAILDILVLHHVNHRAFDKRLADICFILNIEDTYVVAYALRKLVALGVVETEKHGKDVTYSTTALGQEYLAHYERIREHCLCGSVDALEFDRKAIEQLGQFLRSMSGLYDQAARAASSI